MDLVDTHAHLDFPQFDEDRDQALARAAAAGLRMIVTIGSGMGVDAALSAVALARAVPGVYATVGVHPHDAGKMEDDHLVRLAELAAYPKVLAIGEIGLDYVKEHSPREVQKKRFRDQLELARRLDLPVIIHDRGAHDDVVAILESDGLPAAGGIMHCFSGGADLAVRLSGMGFYISFPGVITFTNAKEMREAARAAPPDRILIETDCPFLAPVPHRGKRNEPAYVALVARELAKTRGESVEQIAKSTTENALRAYGLSALPSNLI